MKFTIMAEKKTTNEKTKEQQSDSPNKPSRVTQYLNPLTLEAESFLNALLTFGINEIDPMLCTALHKVTTAINKFIDKDLTEIVPNDNLKLITSEELSTLKRLYFCKTCNVYLSTSPGACKHLLNGHNKITNGTDAADNITHVQDKGSKRKERREKRIQELPPKAKSLFLSNLQLFRTESLLVAEKLKSLPQYEFIEHDLIVLVKPLFPDKSIKLYKFGSRVAGIATCNSDLDIFIDIDNSFEIFENRASQTTLQKLRTVRARLKAAKKQWATPQAIENTRVPIIKTRHLGSGIEVDIGFSNALGYCNTELVCYIMQLQPIARRVCLFLKRWLDRCKFHDISSYAISLMVIYYLQILKKLPAIDHLQSPDNFTTVGPWKSNFLKLTLDKFGMVEIEDNLVQWKSLQQGFFQYYAEFDYGHKVICPLLGRTVNIKTLNAEMPERYTTWVENKNPCLEMTSIVVQDPIQLNHNIAKNIALAKLNILKRYFALSAKEMAPASTSK